MSGWQINATLGGHEPDGRGGYQRYAAWLEKEADAIAAVKKHIEQEAGSSDRRLEAKRPLTDEQLKNCGLKGVGDVKLMPNGEVLY